MYDPSIGRFHTVDLLARTYDFQTPYAYAVNNPIRYIDVYGMGPGESIGNFFAKIKNAVKDFSDAVSNATDAVVTAVKSVSIPEVKTGSGSGSQAGGETLTKTGGGASPTTQKSENPAETTNIDGMLPAIGAKTKSTSISTGANAVNNIINNVGSVKSEISSMKVDAASKVTNTSSNSNSKPKLDTTYHVNTSGKTLSYAGGPGYNGHMYNHGDTTGFTVSYKIGIKTIIVSDSIYKSR